MTHRVLTSAICLGLSIGLLVGCERETETTTTGSTAPATTPAEPAPRQTTPATSYQPTTPPASAPTQTAANGQQHSATGTVTAVDTEGKTITVDHQAVASLNWPAMTMTFEVQDPQQMQDLQAGDRVDFAFVDAGNNRYLIQRISEQSGASQLSQQDEDSGDDSATDDRQ